MAMTVRILRQHLSALQAQKREVIVMDKTTGTRHVVFGFDASEEGKLYIWVAPENMVGPVKA